MSFDSTLYGKSSVLETWAVQPRFAAIVIGSLISLALQVLFGLLGNTLAISSFTLVHWKISDPSEMMAGGFLALSLFMSFSSGGYVSARLANQPFRIATLLHGLGVWALVFLVVFFLGHRSSPVLLGGLFKSEGLVGLVGQVENGASSLTAGIAMCFGAFASCIGALAARRPLVAAPYGYTSHRPVPKVA